MKQPLSSPPYGAIAFVVVLFAIPFLMVVCRGPAITPDPTPAVPTLPPGTPLPTPAPSITAYVVIGPGVQKSPTPRHTATPEPAVFRSTVTPDTAVTVVPVTPLLPPPTLEPERHVVPAPVQIPSRRQP